MGPRICISNKFAIAAAAAGLSSAIRELLERRTIVSFQNVFCAIIYYHVIEPTFPLWIFWIFFLIRVHFILKWTCGFFLFYFGNLFWFLRLHYGRVILSCIIFHIRVNYRILSSQVQGTTYCLSLSFCYSPITKT